MNAALPGVVVDASVGIKLFITEEFSDNAVLLFAQLTDTPTGQISVPDLFFVECANILWKHVRRFGYPVSKAYADINLLNALTLTNYPTLTLTSDALRIAVAEGISAYDACYIALADRLDVPLITADERLARTLSRSDYQVVWLGEPDSSG